MEKLTKIIRNKSDLASIISELVTLDVTEPKKIDVSDYKVKRNDCQNRLYWKWVDHIANKYNVSKDEIHLKLAFRFLPTNPFSKPLMFNGVSIGAWPVSTTTLNIKEFSEYLNEIEAFCHTDLRIYDLPHPEDLYYEATR